MKEFQPYYGVIEVDEMQEVEELAKEIEEKTLFRSLENIRLLQTVIEQKVRGNVMVMLSDNNTILIKVRNNGLEYKYRAESCCLQETIGIVLNDFLFKYRQYVLSKYFLVGWKAGET